MSKERKYTLDSSNTEVRLMAFKWKTFVRHWCKRTWGLFGNIIIRIKWCSNAARCAIYSSKSRGLFPIRKRPRRKSASGFWSAPFGWLLVLLLTACT